MVELEPIESQSIPLCEVLDRVLNKGAVIKAEITISVAGVDLVYLGLNAMLTSIETGRRLLEPEYVEVKLDEE